MGADILVLPGVTAPAAPADLQPDPDVIALLEHFLELARTGELRAVALAGMKMPGIISTTWTGAARGHTLGLSAAIMALHARYGAMLTDISAPADAPESV